MNEIGETKKIKLLQSTMINKIAAGEVVENPVSVVKELVENSIDAQASSVTIEIKDGGTTYIRITDNGVGIPREEIKTAFLRHATSKIADMDDLWNVMTLGFRGEALSSIASVANVEMLTKTATDLSGYRLEIQDGQVVSESEMGAASGTSVIVRNLFYNVPVRKKFLKKPAAEAGYISEMVNRLALGHPGVAFKFINNSSIILQTRGNNDPKEAIFQVYGKEVFKNLMEVGYEGDALQISGYVGKPSIARGTRNYENFFINGRYIKSELMRSAVEDAYKMKLLSGKFPFFVIYLSLRPTDLDVNVHPTKLEVRFSDENLIYRSIFDAVTEVLTDNLLIPEIKLGADKGEGRPKFSEVSGMPVTVEAEVQTIFERPTEQKKYGAPPENKPVYYNEPRCDKEPVPYNEPRRDKEPVPYNEPRRDKGSVPYNEPLTYSEPVTYNRADGPFKSVALKFSEGDMPDDKRSLKIFNDYKIIGQVFGTYWIVECEEKIYIIDQHAAHERILYDELSESLRNKKVAAQRLLQPLIVKLSVSEEQTVKDNMELIDEFGFEVEEYGERTYAVRTVPYIIKGSVSSKHFIELVDCLSNISTSVSNIYETKTEALAMAACKAAIKGNDRLSHLEAKALIEKMMELKEPFNCPHGRPTVIEMSRYELEKKFMRV